MIIQHCWLISLWLLPPPWTNGGETAEAPYWAGFGHLNAPPSRRRYPVCLQPTAELIQWGSMESLENIGPCWWIDYIDLTMHIWVTYVPMPIKCQPLRVTTLPFSVAHGYWVVHWRLAATVPPPRSPLDFQLETPGHIPMLLPWLVAAGCSWLQLVAAGPHTTFSICSICHSLITGSAPSMAPDLKCWLRWKRERRLLGARDRDRLHAAFKRSAIL